MFLNNNTFIDIFKKGALTLASKVLGLLLSYGVVLFVTKNYGAAIYGKFSLSVVLSQIIALVFTLGLPNFIIKLVTNNLHFDKQHKTDFFKKIRIIIFLVGLPIAFFFFFFSNFIAETIFNDSSFTSFLQVLGVLVLPVMFHEIFLGFFKGNQNFKLHNFFSFILPPSLFFLTYFFLNTLYQEKDALPLLAYTLAVILVTLIEYLYINQVKILNQVKKVSAKAILKRSMPMMYSGALLYLISWTDVFMLKLFRSSTEVGIYSAVFKVASLTFLVITSVNIVMTPKISDLFLKKEMSLLHKTIVKSTWFTIICSIPIVVGIIFFRKNLLSMFGEEFIEGSEALIIIVIGIFLNIITGVVDQVLNMTDHQKVLKNIIVVSLFLNIFLNYLLIPKRGIEGAALASLITNIFLNFTCVYFVKKKLGFYTFI